MTLNRSDITEETKVRQNSTIFMHLCFRPSNIVEYRALNLLDLWNKVVRSVLRDEASSGKLYHFDM